MCYEASSDNGKKCRTAEKDIRVVKFVESYKDNGKWAIRSYFNNYPYKIGHTYSTDCMPREYCEDINQGYHSYSLSKGYPVMRRYRIYSAIGFPFPNDNDNNGMDSCRCLLGSSHSVFIKGDHLGEMFECTPKMAKYFFSIDEFARKDNAHFPVFSVMYCTIPKGSIYYENEEGEIVSDQIRPDKIYKMGSESRLCHLIGRIILWYDKNTRIKNKRYVLDR
jgi:hypothetical protein